MKVFSPNTAYDLVLLSENLDDLNTSLRVLMNYEKDFAIDNPGILVSVCERSLSYHFKSKIGLPHLISLNSLTKIYVLEAKFECSVNIPINSVYVISICSGLFE